MLAEMSTSPQSPDRPRQKFLDAESMMDLTLSSMDVVNIVACGKVEPVTQILQTEASPAPAAARAGVQSKATVSSSLGKVSSGRGFTGCFATCWSRRAGC